VYAKKNATFYTFQQMFTHFFYFLTCSIKVILDAQTFTFKRKNSFKATLLSLATHLSARRTNIFLKLEPQKKKNSFRAIAAIYPPLDPKEILPKSTVLGGGK